MDETPYPRPPVETELARNDRRHGIASLFLFLFEIAYVIAAGRFSITLGEQTSGGLFAVVLACTLGLLLAVARLVGGIGIVQGRRWAFIVSVAASILALVPYAVAAYAIWGIPFLLLDGAFLFYCWRRLSGRLGERPV